MDEVTHPNITLRLKKTLPIGLNAQLEGILK